MQKANICSSEGDRRGRGGGNVDREGRVVDEEQGTTSSTGWRGVVLSTVWRGRWWRGSPKPRRRGQTRGRRRGRRRAGGAAAWSYGSRRRLHVRGDQEGLGEERG